jgi:hypothetical protein
VRAWQSGHRFFQSDYGILQPGHPLLRAGLGLNKGLYGGLRAGLGLGQPVQCRLYAGKPGLRCLPILPEFLLRAGLGLNKGLYGGLRAGLGLGQGSDLDLGALLSLGQFAHLGGESLYILPADGQLFPQLPLHGLHQFHHRHLPFLWQPLDNLDVTGHILLPAGSIAQIE